MDIVDERMKFISFDDFYQRCESIKYYYERLSTKEKRIYRMYIYSDRFLSEKVADKMWEYLNEPLGSVYYVSKETLQTYLRG